MIRIALTSAAICLALSTAPLRADTYSPTPTDAVYPEPGGIRLKSQDGTAIWDVPFGTPFHILMPALQTVLGDGFEMAFPAECPAGPVIIVHFPDVFDLVFQEDRLQGWSLPYEAPRTTYSGLGWGSSVAFLEQNYEVERFESTLGDEFSAEGLSGIIEDGMVSHLWSGITCIYR